MMKNFEKKIIQAKKVIKKLYSMFPKEKIVIAWTGGKDSTVLLHLVRDMFDNQVPFPVMFNDSTMEFDEIYDFIRKITRDWSLNLITVPHLRNELDHFHRTNNLEKKKELSRIMKIHATEEFVKRTKIRAFIVGIRRDEHPARADEVYFSKRANHLRVHPLLDFTEADIWKYIKRNSVPYVSLYDHGYRSIGEKPFTKRVKKGGKERDGREREKEQMMEKLRSLGYW